MRLGLRRGLELGHIRAHLVFKQAMHGGFKLIFRREVDAQGIDILLVFVEFEVEVRARGSPGGADKSYNLSLGNAYTRLDAFGKTIQMGISARIGGVVFDVYGFAITAIPAGFGDAC